MTIFFEKCLVVKVIPIVPNLMSLEFHKVHSQQLFSGTFGTFDDVVNFAAGLYLCEIPCLYRFPMLNSSSPP